MTHNPTVNLAVGLWHLTGYVTLGGPTKRERTMGDSSLWAEPAADRMIGMVQCEQCGRWHWAEYSHVSRHGGHFVYAVTCTVDNLTDYYIESGVDFTRGA